MAFCEVVFGFMAFYEDSRVFVRYLTILKDVFVHDTRNTLERTAFRMDPHRTLCDLMRFNAVL